MFLKKCHLSPGGLMWCDEWYWLGQWGACLRSSLFRYYTHKQNKNKYCIQIKVTFKVRLPKLNILLFTFHKMQMEVERGSVIPNPKTQLCSRLGSHATFYPLVNSATCNVQCTISTTLPTFSSQISLACKTSMGEYKSPRYSFSSHSIVWTVNQSLEVWTDFGFKWHH